VWPEDKLYQDTKREVGLLYSLRISVRKPLDVNNKQGVCYCTVSALAWEGAPSWNVVTVLIARIDTRTGFLNLIKQLEKGLKGLGF
jgi:hypothetical protein